MHHVGGDGLHVKPCDKVQHPRLLRLRHLIHPHGRRKKAFQLALQRKMDVALSGHIAAHESRRADVHLIKIAVGIPRKIRPEDGLQLRRGVQVDILRRVRQGVGLEINFPQALVQLREGQLDGRFRRIGVHRRQTVAHKPPRHAELPAEHGLHQLHEHRVLGGEQVLKAPPRHAGLLHDLGDGGLPIPLLQKQADAHGKDLLFRFDTVFSQRHRQLPSTS